MDNVKKEYKALVTKVEKEYLEFKDAMLQRTVNEVFDSSNIINFYSCIYEYVIYNDDIDDKYIIFLLTIPNIMQSLYNEYLKNEYLEYSKWSAIEEMLDVAIYKNSRLSKKE